MLSSADILCSCLPDLLSQKLAHWLFFGFSACFSFQVKNPYEMNKQTNRWTDKQEP